MEEQNVQEVVKRKRGRPLGIKQSEETKAKIKATRARKRAEKETLMVQNAAGNGGSLS